MKKKVFLVFSNLGLGGVQTKMISLANRLVTMGIECWVFVEELGPNSRVSLFDPRVKIIRSLALRVFHKRPFWGWRFLLLVVIVACIKRPQTIFVSLAHLSVQLLRILSVMCPGLSKRVVVNEDTYPSGEYAHYNNRELVSKNEIKKYYNHAKLVIAVSQSTYKNLREQFGVFSPPLTLLPNWTSFLSASRPSAKNRDIDLLYAGRLDAQKQPEVLASVLSGILKKRPQTVVQIYGDGKLLGAFKYRLKTLGIYDKVIVLPPVENIATVLTKSKILLFTSRYEGLPFVGVEAMRAGAIVACFEAPGLRDMVRDGSTGLMKRAAPVLIESTARLLDNPAALRRMRLAAFLYAREKFSERNEERLIQMMLE